MQPFSVENFLCLSPRQTISLLSGFHLCFKALLPRRGEGMSWASRGVQILEKAEGRSTFIQQTLKVIWNVNWLWAVCKVPSQVGGGIGPSCHQMPDRHIHLWLIRSRRNKVILMFLFFIYYLFIYVSNHFTAWTSNLWKANVSIGTFGSEAPGNPFQFLYPGESFHHLDPRAKRQGLWGQQVGLNRRLHITQLPCFLLVD